LVHISPDQSPIATHPFLICNEEVVFQEAVAEEDLSPEVEHHPEVEVEVVVGVDLVVEVEKNSHQVPLNWQVISSSKLQRNGFTNPQVIKLHFVIPMHTMKRRNLFEK
jgi:hypothetical protein